MTWEPACMDDAELAEYRAGVLVGCRDCTEAFASDQRAEGRCNGIPGEVVAGVVKEDDVDQEPIPITRRIAAEVSVPCGTCIHSGICRIEPTLRELTRLQVALPATDDAIHLELSAHVGCDHYAKAKGAKPVDGEPKRKHQISPEGLERMRESGRRSAERRRAAAGEPVPA